MNNNTRIFIGDIHGLFYTYCELIEMYNEYPTIQVGDFGWGFPDDNPDEINELNQKMAAGDHKWIRGNHDNPHIPNEFRIPDGTYDEETGIFHLGGAYSVDRHSRIEGVDWWPEEELSIVEFNKAIDTFIEKKPRVVVTHDGPTEILKSMFPWFHDDFGSRTRQALDSMLEHHQPELHIFGHWHYTTEVKVGPTTFVCVGALDHIFVDMDTLKITYSSDIKSRPKRGFGHKTS